jgi:SUKH-4 immunity protein
VTWPKYETVTFDLGSPEAAALALTFPCVNELATVGAPRSVIGQSESDPALTVIPTHQRWLSGSGQDERNRPGGPLIRFATSGPNVAVALDPESGEVVTVVDLEGLHGGPFARLMNSSLAHLRATARAVIARFPYYDESQGDEGREAAQRAQNDLLRLIEEADPRAFEESGGWSEFPWDVGMGDFDTASIVGMP